MLKGGKHYFQMSQARKELEVLETSLAEAKRVCNISQCLVLCRRIIGLANALAIGLFQTDGYQQALAVLKKAVRADLFLYQNGGANEKLWSGRAVTYNNLAFLYRHSDDAITAAKFLGDSLEISIRAQAIRPFHTDHLLASHILKSNILCRANNHSESQQAALTARDIVCDLLDIDIHCTQDVSLPKQRSTVNDSLNFEEDSSTTGSRSRLDFELKICALGLVCLHLGILEDVLCGNDSINSSSWYAKGLRYMSTLCGADDTIARLLELASTDMDLDTKLDLLSSSHLEKALLQTVISPFSVSHIVINADPVDGFLNVEMNDASFLSMEDPLLTCAEGRRHPNADAQDVHTHMVRYRNQLVSRKRPQTSERNHRRADSGGMYSETHSDGEDVPKRNAINGRMRYKEVVAKKLAVRTLDAAYLYIHSNNTSWSNPGDEREFLKRSAVHSKVADRLTTKQARPTSKVTEQIIAGIESDPKLLNPAPHEAPKPKQKRKSPYVVRGVKAARPMSALVQLPHAEASGTVKGSPMSSPKAARLVEDPSAFPSPKPTPRQPPPSLATNTTAATRHLPNRILRVDHSFSTLPCAQTAVSTAGASRPKTASPLQRNRVQISAVGDSTVAARSLNLDQGSSIRLPQANKNTSRDFRAPKRLSAIDQLDRKVKIFDQVKRQSRPSTAYIRPTRSQVSGSRNTSSMTQLPLPASMAPEAMAQEPSIFEQKIEDQLLTVMHRTNSTASGVSVAYCEDFEHPSRSNSPSPSHTRSLVHEPHTNNDMNSSGRVHSPMGSRPSYKKPGYKPAYIDVIGHVHSDHMKALQGRMSKQEKRIELYLQQANVRKIETETTVSTILPLVSEEVLADAKEKERSRQPLPVPKDLSTPVHATERGRRTIVQQQALVSPRSTVASPRNTVVSPRSPSSLATSFPSSAEAEKVLVQKEGANLLQRASRQCVSEVIERVIRRLSTDSVSCTMSETSTASPRAYDGSVLRLRALSTQGVPVEEVAANDGLVPARVDGYTTECSRELVSI